MPEIVVKRVHVAIAAVDIPVGHLCQGESGAFYIRMVGHILGMITWDATSIDTCNTMYIDLGPLEIVEE